jgi:hypothetical protein
VTNTRWIIARVLRAFAHDRGRAWLTAGRVEWARTETLVGHRPLPMRQGPNYRSWGVATAKCSRWRDRLAFRLLALVDRHPADKRVWLDGHPLGKARGKSCDRRNHMFSPGFIPIDLKSVARRTVGKCQISRPLFAPSGAGKVGFTPASVVSRLRFLASCSHQDQRPSPQETGGRVLRR